MDGETQFCITINLSLRVLAGIHYPAAWADMWAVAGQLTREYGAGPIISGMKSGSFYRNTAQKQIQSLPQKLTLRHELKRHQNNGARAGEQDRHRQINRNTKTGRGGQELMTKEDRKKQFQPLHDGSPAEHTAGRTAQRLRFRQGW